MRYTSTESVLDLISRLIVQTARFRRKPAYSDGPYHDSDLLKRTARQKYVRNGILGDPQIR